MTPFTLPTPETWVFPAETFVVVQFPDRWEHDGRVFRKIDKHGTRISDGCPSQCYQGKLCQRIWLAADGTVTND